MSMLRFPLELPPPPKRRESWRQVIAGGIVVILALLLLTYVVFPAVEYLQEQVAADVVGGR